ncbi:hypothetical protein ONZ45_g9630 [Pleurotus djamor]|nr:hypothetical protein ONZ45_g9630 [Pleurotus djamor]
MAAVSSFIHPYNSPTNFSTRQGHPVAITEVEPILYGIDVQQQLPRPSTLEEQPPKRPYGASFADGLDTVRALTGTMVISNAL